VNIVLYTNDFEPITILDLPIWLLEALETRGSVRVAAIDTTRPDSSAEPEFAVVTIHLEKLPWRDGTKKYVLVTADEELALALKPDWLPGQRQVIQGYEMAIRDLTDRLVKALRK